ncbi:MAG: tol-pal system protein YbgF [Proteobacteria bacterium]|nr:tol-pal system protein YbgF [Pseudomonadota bacterium]
MKVMAKKALVIALMLTPMISSNVWADEAVLSQRIERLERIIKGQGLMSLMGRVDQLQNEVQRLNGDNESLRHELETMQKRQRELYLDLDQRLQAQVVVPVSTVVTEPTAPVTVETPQPTAENPVEATAAVKSDEQPKSPDSAPVAIENGEAAYQAALQTLRSGQYEQAVTALTAFPEKYPHSNYLPNAYYWQGEANYVLRHFDLAIAAFQNVIDRFPASSKVADATLKQGFSQYELGNVEEAKATLKNVMEQYPNTSAARLAKVRLDRIKQDTQ